MAPVSDLAKSVRRNLQTYAIILALVRWARARHYAALRES